MKEKSEAIQISLYIEIIITILNTYSDMSIIQIIFYAYLVNKTRFFKKDVYTAKTDKEIVVKAISEINGSFGHFAESVPYIIKTIHIMNKAGIVYVEDGFIHFKNKNCKRVNCFELSNFIKKAMSVSVGWSDKRFIKEVLHCV